MRHPVGDALWRGSILLDFCNAPLNLGALFVLKSPFVLDRGALP